MEEEGKATVVISGYEEGEEWVEKVKDDIHNPNTVKKLRDKGILRMDRHPIDGLRHRGHEPPKSGHGGKFTWEGPDDIVDSELEPVPAAIDLNDPNYVDNQKEGPEVDLVVGEVEVAKVAEVGVSRVVFPAPLSS